MLACMGEPDPGERTMSVYRSEPGMTGLPTGTVTLLLADIEGSTGLWQTRPETMGSAVARLDASLVRLTRAHNGVRPVEQGEGDSFVIAFTRASDAIACALDLQRAPLAPIRLRIGIHSGEIQLRDDANYIGPTINRTARVRDLGHGGQILLTAATEQLVVDHLPAGAWLADLGSHELRNIARRERILQLCHPDLRVAFPPLRSAQSLIKQPLPLSLTSFVGRAAELSELRTLLGVHRLVTLTGAGGVGKTRLAVQLASDLATEFRRPVYFVDLAPISDPDLVAGAVAATVGLHDQPGRPAIDCLAARLADGEVLIVLDNCEHLLGAAAAVVDALLSRSPGLRLLATSREPLRTAAEVNWQVPSLPLENEAVALFTDRACQVRPDFTVTDHNVEAITEICRRLDGMPLAIELAAARIRALSAVEIRDSLRDRFELLTGGARTAVRRQQTLRASVDWSYSLLTETESVLFRELAVFVGSFDLDAALAVCGSTVVQRYQVLDQLTLLVDKSLVLADSGADRTRYRMLETIREYAVEKLRESGQLDAVRARHREYYTTLTTRLDTLLRNDFRGCVADVEVNLDNVRAALAYSCEQQNYALALRLTSALQPLWQGRGRLREGLMWFDTILGDADRLGSDSHDPGQRAIVARALADKAVLDSYTVAAQATNLAERAVTIARDLDDPALLARALTARGCAAALDFASAAGFFDEALGLVRSTGDNWCLSQVLGRQAYLAAMAGDATAASALGGEGAELAEALGDWPNLHLCRWSIGMAQMFRAQLAGAIATFRAVINACQAENDVVGMMLCLVSQGCALVYSGQVSAAQQVGRAAIAAGAELDVVLERTAATVVAMAAVAEDDVATARNISASVWQHPAVHRGTVAVSAVALCAHAYGDLTAAQSLADQSVHTLAGWHLLWALTIRSYVAAARGDKEAARRDVHRALVLAAGTEARLGLAAALECLASLVIDSDGHLAAARFLGAADAVRHRTGEFRFPVHERTTQTALDACRDELGDEAFAAAYAEGAHLSTEDVINYALRGRSERKRPASGWEALTPAELDVARLVSEGLPNKDIAERLFISPRTVQAHLTHVYTKLGYTSRVQLAQEAVRRTDRA
ncbi:LuxR family transcriptional regulator [Mycobacterium kubicae]|uniref:LuxR family transcriptional regulator n=3 Tax=Mycobacterium kubicae TaxID=120959 RepID=A0ABQ1BSL0_9MYCO|nr:LuxR family transcriptional regulator [Mycobacterium kubicae]